MSTLFVSYNHAENKKEKWLERLTAFLDGVQERLPMQVFADVDDIRTGDEWRRKIDAGIADAAAAILLVGREFLKSEFIRTVELPALLEAARKNRVRLYPLVVTYCLWEESALGKYQAFNDPAKPLEAMSRPQQNRWLNDLCRRVLSDARASGPGTEVGAGLQSESGEASPRPTNAAPASGPDLVEKMAQIAEYLQTTRRAFSAQASLRDDLYTTMLARLHAEPLEYERFFFRHYNDMNAEERFIFRQIRAYTEGPLHDANPAMLKLIDATPALRDELPILAALKHHLVVWLNKYERVFVGTPEMGVLYTGVEDGVPFPFGVDNLVTEWLASHRPR